MDFLSIFLEDFRGPRKTVFCLKITHSKIAGNHGALQPKSTNFQSLVFIPKCKPYKTILKQHLRPHHLSTVSNAEKIQIWAMFQ